MGLEWQETVEATERSRKQVGQLLGDFANGRDEMNLVEFPLALLSERAPEGVLTLECSDEIEEKGVPIQRQVVVAATEKYGLPTAKDEDVLMGLLQLAKLQNEFTSPVVPFTRLQLITLLGWENTRWSYERIALALERWLSVSITYRKAWRDNKDREWQDRSGFGLIDSYRLRDSRRAGRGGRGGDGAADRVALVVPLERLPLRQLPVRATSRSSTTASTASSSSRRPSGSTATSTSISTSRTGCGSTSTSRRSPSSTWG